MKMFKSENANKARFFHRGAIKNQSKLQCSSNKSAVAVTDMAGAKAGGGSVTKITLNMKMSKSENANKARFFHRGAIKNQHRTP